jgi:hypothetical protein
VLHATAAHAGSRGGAISAQTPRMDRPRQVWDHPAPGGRAKVLRLVARMGTDPTDRAMHATNRARTPLSRPRRALLSLSLSHTHTHTLMDHACSSHNIHRAPSPPACPLPSSPQLARGDLDGRVVGELAALGAEDGLIILQQFEDAGLDTVRNKSGYLHGRSVGRVHASPRLTRFARCLAR